MTPDLETLPPLRDVIARYGLAAKKSLGQHFLCDLNLTRKIVRSAGELKGCTVVEVGPGPGGLTRALLESDANKVIAVEKDERCLAALAEIAVLSGHQLEIIAGDAMKTPLLDLTTEPRAVIANLPYNIGTELLLGWLHQMPYWQSLTLMFQAEVVDRIVAEPHNKAYGRLAVISQFCCHVERKMTLPASAFTPPPKVNSAIVHLTPRLDRPQDVSLAVLEKVTATAFGQRRKMLRSSLAALGGEALCVRANINPTLRAENLTLTDFENLARLVAEH